MNTKVGKPIGIALILAVAALVATLAAMSLGSTPAAAQTTENSAVYATGDDGSTTLTVMVHNLSPVQSEAENRLIFSMEGFPERPTEVTFASSDEGPTDLAMAGNPGNEYRYYLRPSPTPRASGNIPVGSSATITLMWDDDTDPRVDPGAMFDIMQLGGSGDNTGIGQISVTFPPRVNLSNMTPGAAVRIILESDEIMGAVGDDIHVELPGFKVPSTISPSNIQISNVGIGNQNVSNLNRTPSDVSVSGTTITLTIPDMDGNGGGEVGLDDNTKTTIRIRQQAGIMNPSLAGEKKITVKHNGGESPTVFDAMINRVVTVSPSSAPRGTVITITGKGFAEGTSRITFTRSDMDDPHHTADVPTGSGHTFSLTMNNNEKNAEGDKIFDGKAATFDGATKITASGSDGKSAKVATHMIKPAFTINPGSPVPGEEVTITLADTDADITGVKFAGKDVELKDNTDNMVMVPSGTRIGDVTMTVTLSDEPPLSKTITIGTLHLSFSQSEVVPGQQITIRGSDFVTGTKVTNVMIGTKEAMLPGDSSVTTGGNVAITVGVPLYVGSGEKKVVLTAQTGTDDNPTGKRTASGTITVAKPSITIDPATSLPGSVISVRGTGFAASARVDVMYGKGIEEVGRTDGDGNVHARLTVPSDSGVGKTNTVEVVVRGEVPERDDPISATANHSTPGAMIMVTEEAHAGGTITITGSNFEGFSILSDVTVGGQRAVPSPAPETDKNGAFEFQVRVPRLSTGHHTVTVKDSSTAGNTATETFMVVATPVVNTPAEAFSELGSNLVAVWKYDNPTANNPNGKWTSYSPTAPAEINDLTGVASGDIVWINLSEAASFQGINYNAGWSLITIE